MRIYTKKAFGFVNPDKTKEVNGTREIVRTTPNEFHEVPEWVAKDDMFKWGKTDGDIEVVTAVEKATSKAVEEKKEEKAVSWVAPAANDEKAKK